jgi:hypothetical protein
MRIDRLEALINFMETLLEENFNITDFVEKFDEQKECNTICCAAGWLWKLDPEFWKIELGCLVYRPSEQLASSYLLEDYFEFESKVIYKIFYADAGIGDGSVLSQSCTVQEWVSNAKQVLEELTMVGQMRISKPATNQGFDDLELFKISEHSSVILDELREDAK